MTDAKELDEILAWLDQGRPEHGGTMCARAADALRELRQERDDAEAYAERQTEAWKKERDRAELLERSAAVTMCKRDALQKLANGWMEAALNPMGVCGTCEGDGYHHAVSGFDSAKGEEITTPEPCPECEGTGRGAVAFAFSQLREMIEDARADRDDAMRQLDAAQIRYEGAAAVLEERRQQVDRLEIDKREVVAALTEVVEKTTDKTEVGMIARRALGMHR